MNQGDYLIWAAGRIDDNVVLNEIEGFDEVSDLNRGVPQGGKFPSAARYTMNDDFPDNTVLTDSLFNTDDLIVGSERLKELLDKRKVTKVEYLPIKVVNHKKKPVGKNYFIIHPVDPVDCLDKGKSGVTFGKIAKTTVKSVDKLVLDPKKLGPDRELFRIANFPVVTLVRRDLAKAMDAAGFTGVRWVELTAYPED